jgi:ADP-ribosylglycohydrolase
MIPLEDRLAGTLLGTALGDALGLPVEGMAPEAVARRFGQIQNFRLLGRTGFVSDDTEQAALVAQSLARHSDDAEACVRDFRRALLGWSLRLPWGAGSATLRACARIALGLPRSGIHSAGNGAAMRAPILGVFFSDRPEERRRFGRAVATVTHLDERAIEGALYSAEMAAACALRSPGAHLFDCYEEARQVASEPSFRAALDCAAKLARGQSPTAEAARVLGTSGFVLHTAAFASFCFLRCGGEPLRALTEVVNAGGDADTAGAVLGAWLGALHGESALPQDLLYRIHDGPFGPTHLRGLAHCLAQIRAGRICPVPGYSVPAALLRNTLLLPVILAHGFRRLLPF